MNNKTLISRLTTLLEQLEIQARQTDLTNSTNKSHKSLENNNLFSLSLFNTQSDRFSPYLVEIQLKLTEFIRLQSSNKIDLSKISLEKIEQQITALMNALHANSTMHQAAKVSIDARKSYRIKAAQTREHQHIAQKIMLSSHQLYQKLTEHHEFERRLMEMVKEREQQLAQCSAIKSKTLSTEVLALHQRLGRCRKAISTIERDIDRAEKR